METLTKTKALSILRSREIKSDFLECSNIYFRCKSLEDFQQNFQKQYIYSVAHDYFLRFEKRLFKNEEGDNFFEYTYDNCVALAKQFDCREEFETKYPLYYRRAELGDWIDEFKFRFISFESKHRYRTTLTAAKICKTIKEFRQRYRKYYINAIRYGWLQYFSWLEPDVEEKSVEVNFEIRESERLFNYEKCLEYASVYSTLEEFKENDPEAYEYAKYFHWLSDYDWFITEKYTREHCFEIAIKCKTMLEFQSKFTSEYNTSKRMGWLEEYGWLTKREMKFRTFDECYNDAKKYDTLNDYYKNDRNSYEKAKREGWLKKFKWLKKLK